MTETEDNRAVVPVVRRATDLSRAAAQQRAARELSIISTPLPTAEADEILILIFHRVFPDRSIPCSCLVPDSGCERHEHPDGPRMKRYTYVAHWRHEPGVWYLSHDSRHRPHGSMTNEDLLRFARPTAPPYKLADEEAWRDTLGLLLPSVKVWFLPTATGRRPVNTGS